MFDEREQLQAIFTSQRIRAGRQLQGSASRAHTLLRAGIRDGTIRSDNQLIEDTLVRTLGASRNAVRSALQMLVDDGLITRAPRRGTEVVGGIIEFNLLTSWVPMARPSGVSHLTRTEVRTVPAHGPAGARLGYSGDVPIPMVEYMASYDGRPTALRVSYHHPDLDPEMYAQLVTDFRPEHEYDPSRPLFTTDDLVRGLYGREPGKSRTALEAQLADARTSKMLDVSIGAPLLVRESLIRDADGVGRILNYMTYDGSRVTLVADEL